MIDWKYFLCENLKGLLHCCLRTEALFQISPWSAVYLTEKNAKMIKRTRIHICWGSSQLKLPNLSQAWEILSTTHPKRSVNFVSACRCQHTNLYEAMSCDQLYIMIQLQASFYYVTVSSIAQLHGSIILFP